ncbi:PEP-CTERM sorting domain-containing protein [Fodinibius sp. AD559]|uniref:PEP-CTERM sorting domain-containing protein n=1 Tax=Fodinibius sp. AD559 TaxID=3424179 RepID=UPI004046D5E0
MKKVNTKKLKTHSLLSILTIVFGVAFLIFMIVVEDEPGTIPLLLIVAGTGWYFITRYRLRSKET